MLLFCYPICYPMTTKIIFNRKKKYNVKNEALVEIEVYVSATNRKMRSTGVWIAPKFWDEQNKQIKKTHPDPKNSISMSKLQLEKASSFLDCYGLLSVDVTKYSGTNDKYKLSLDEIIPLIKVLKGIGSDILPLIQNNLLAEKNTESTVKLADFRGLINQDIMNRQGTSFETFVDWLIQYLKSQVLNETGL